jgi:hypothetical protein
MNTRISCATLRRIAVPIRTTPPSPSRKEESGFGRRGTGCRRDERREDDERGPVDGPVIPTTAPVANRSASV